METKHLDSLIKNLETLKSINNLSELGQETLNEYKAIKQALSQHDVVKSVCDICEKEGENRIYCSCQNCGEIYKHKQTVL